MARKTDSDQVHELLLQALETEGYGSYPTLARMRAATVLADRGDQTGAVAGFDAVAADGSVPQIIRDMAKKALEHMHAAVSSRRQ